jgi:hypothetical protein
MPPCPSPTASRAKAAQKTLPAAAVAGAAKSRAEGPLLSDEMVIKDSNAALFSSAYISICFEG